MRRVYKNLFPATISASVMAANMCKNSLKNAESDNNKIFLRNFTLSLLQRKGNYFLNNLRLYVTSRCRCVYVISAASRLFIDSVSGSQIMPGVEMYDHEGLVARLGGDSGPCCGFIPIFAWRPKENH